MRPFCAAILLLLAHPAAAAEEEVTREITLTPEMQSGIAAYLQVLGYNCPLAKSSHFLEANAYGNVVQVRCGPVNTDGFYKFASFRFTYHPNGRVTVVPCSFWFCSVDD